MIDEDTLTRLLSEHAEGIPVPESAIADLLAAAPDREPGATGVRLVRPSARLLAAAAAVVVVVGGVWAVDAHRGGRAQFTATGAPTG